MKIYAPAVLIKGGNPPPGININDYMVDEIDLLSVIGKPPAFIIMPNTGNPFK